MKGFRFAMMALVLALTGCGDGSIQSPNFTPQLTVITVAPDTASVAAGRTVAFTATGQYTTPPGAPPGSDTRDITTEVNWSTDDSAIATIDAGRGIARGASIGEAVVTASLDGKSDSATLTVTAAELTQIVVQPANPVIGLGGSQVFTALGVYSDSPTPRAIDGTVTWTSSDPAVAPVVPAVGATTTATGATLGTTTITATVTPGGLTGSTILTISSAFPVALVRVDPPTASVAPRRSREFQAIARFSDNTEAAVDDASINWSSSDLTIATIAPDGIATAASIQGVTTITAAFKDSVTNTTGAREATARLTVTDEVCTLPLLESDGAIATKHSVGIACVACDVANLANVTDANPDNYAEISVLAGLLGSGQGLRVTASGTGVPFAGGQQPGFVIGRSAGTLLLDELLELALLQNFTVSTFLNGNEQESSGALIPLRLNLLGLQLVGNNETALATINATLPYDAIQVTLISSVSVLSDVQVYSACAATEPPQPDSPLVNVARVEPETATVEAGAKTEFVAFGEFEDGSEAQLSDADLDWSSAPETVATVEANGLVTGVAAGAAEITATLKPAVPATGTRSSAAALEVIAPVCTAPLLDTDEKTATVTDDINGLICIGCSITDQPNIVDEAKTNYASVSIPVGLVGAGASITVTAGPDKATPTVPVVPFAVGGKPGFIVGAQANDLVSLELLGLTTISTLLDGVVQETSTSPSLLSLGLFSQGLLGYDSSASLLSFPDATTMAYDAVRINFNTLATVLGNVRVFSACATTDVPAVIPAP